MIERFPHDPEEVLDRVARDIAAAVHTQAEHQSHAAVYAMARDTVAKGYEQYAEGYEQLWSSLEAMLLDLPTDSIGFYTGAGPYYQGMEVEIPAHALFRFEQSFAKDGVEMDVLTNIHALPEKPHLNKRLRGPITDTQRFSGILDEIRRGQHELEHVDDVHSVRPTAHPTLGIRTERVGIRKHVITQDRQREELLKRQIEWKRQLLGETNYYYTTVRVSAHGVGTQGSEVAYVAGIGRVDFEPDRWQRYLPGWPNSRAGVRVPHGLFNNLDSETGVYDYVVTELPKYIPDRDSSYETMARIINVAESSAPSRGSTLGICDEDRTRMYETLDFMAGMGDQYRYPYKTRDVGFFPPA